MAGLRGTDDKGHFVIEQAPPGEALVTWLPRGGLQRMRSARYYQTAFVEVQPGKTARVNLMEEGGQAELLRREPQPPCPPGLAEADRKEWLARWWIAEAARIERYRRRGFTHRLTLEVDGSFRVDEVQPGTYEPHVRVAGYAELVRQVVVPAVDGKSAGGAVDLGNLALEASPRPADRP